MFCDQSQNSSIVKNNFVGFRNSIISNQLEILFLFKSRLQNIWSITLYFHCLLTSEISLKKFATNIFSIDQKREKDRSRSVGLQGDILKPRLCLPFNGMLKPFSVYNGNGQTQSVQSCRVPLGYNILCLNINL